MNPREMLIELDGAPRLRCAKCSAMMTVAPWNPPTWQCGGCGATEPLTIEQSRRAAELKRGRESDPEPSKLTAEEEAALWDVIRGAFHFLERIPAEHGVYPPAGLMDSFRKVLFGDYTCPLCKGSLELRPSLGPGFARPFRCQACNVDVTVSSVLAPPDHPEAHVREVRHA